MNRRNFIGSLMASVVGLSLAPSKLLWEPAEAALALPTLHQGALVGLNAITMETLKHLVDILQVQVPTLKGTGDGVKVGEAENGVVLAHQYTVGFEPPSTLDQRGLRNEQFCLPSAHALAARLGTHHLTGCGELVLPTLVDSNHIMQSCRMTHAPSGLSLRGIHGQWYDLEEGVFRNTIRFDILVAGA